MYRELQVPEGLRAFLAEYVLWVEAGAKPSPIFSREYGLCAALAIWPREDAEALGVAFLQLLNVCFGDRHFTPFNNSRTLSYPFETKRKECHLNPNRLEFAKKASTVPFFWRVRERL